MEVFKAISFGGKLIFKPIFGWIKDRTQPPKRVKSALVEMLTPTMADFYSTATFAEVAAKARVSPNDIRSQHFVHLADVINFSETISANGTDHLTVWPKGYRLFNQPSNWTRVKCIDTFCDFRDLMQQKNKIDQEDLVDFDQHRLKFIIAFMIERGYINATPHLGGVWFTVRNTDCGLTEFLFKD